METEARKQLLLTRIALERAQWTRDLDALRQAARPSRLVSEALGVGWLARLFNSVRPSGAGASSATGLLGRLVQGWLMLRRQPLLWSLVAGAWSWTRKRDAPRRSLVRWGLVAALGVALAGAVWAISRKTPPPQP